MTQSVRPAPHRRGGAPFLGATLSYIRDPLRMMREQYDACGPVSELDFLGGRWTVLLGPDACGVALQNTDKAFANGPGWGEIVGPFFDRGLMLLDFEEHHRHRMTDAAGVHPRPARRLHRGDGSRRRDRPRRLAARARLPGLSRAEVADPRPGHPGVHGWRRPRPRRTSWSGSTRRSSPACRPPPGSSGARCRAPDGAGRCAAGTCSRSSSVGTSPPSGPRRRGRPVLGAVLPARRRRGGALRQRRRQPHDLPADGRPRHLDDHGHHDDAPAGRAPASGAHGCARRRPTCPTARPSTSSTRWSPSTW